MNEDASREEAAIGDSRHGDERSAVRRDTSERRPRTKRALTYRGGMSLIFATFAVGGLLSIPWAVSYLKRQDAGYADVIFPMILVAGVVCLLATLALLAGLFKALGISNENFALGMPDGSIRAVIALMLILLFGMMSIFLYVDSATVDTRQLLGVSQQRVDEIPAGELVSIRPARDPGSFDVTRRVLKSAQSADIAKQLITTISTLVVAIAAFYFGSQTTGAAQRTPGQPPSRDLAPEHRTNPSGDESPNLATPTPGDSKLVADQPVDPILDVRPEPQSP